jgi:AcrR family transcriptional regulator
MQTESAPKNRLFQTAARLFYQRGYRAIGVDTLAAESGIGKMTLYRHYPSKDDLITAYLRDSDEAFWNYFNQLTRDVSSPREKLLAFFRGLQAYVNTPACYGCPFLNVATEYPETNYPGHQVALEHKRTVRARFHELASQAGAKDPAALADQLFLLMDGAYMAARMFGAGNNPAVQVAAAAQTLIDASLGDPDISGHAV